MDGVPEQLCGDTKHQLEGRARSGARAAAGSLPPSHAESALSVGHRKGSAALPSGAHAQPASEAGVARPREQGRSCAFAGPS